MTKSEIVKMVIDNAKKSGKFYSITFVKKDGSIRKAVTKRITWNSNGTTKTRTSSYSIIFYDLNKKGWIRCSPDKVTQIKALGVTITFS